MARVTVRARLAWHPEKVYAAEERARKNFLYRAGGYVRSVARRLLKRGRGISQPGSPPLMHVGSIKNLMMFDVNLRASRVTIGPAPLGTGLPEALEFGGSVRVKGGKTIEIGRAHV